MTAQKNIPVQALTVKTAAAKTRCAAEVVLQVAKAVNACLIPSPAQVSINEQLID